MSNGFDYHNYDKLKVTAKTAKEKELVSHYAYFGWKETDRKEDKRFFDIAHITFTRPHKIKNKDRLQLLQIYYEAYMNELYECEKTAYTGSASFMASACLTAVILAAIGVVFLFSVPLAMRILGGTLCFFAAFTVAVSAHRTKKLYKREKSNYNERVNKLKNNIEEVLGIAKALAGEGYEK